MTPAPADHSETQPRPRFLQIGRGWKILILALLLMVLLNLVWNWNWFRPLSASQASITLGREVTLGRFDVHLGRQIGLEFDDLAVANPASFSADNHLLKTRQLMLRIDPWPLLHGTLKLDAVQINQPRIDPRTDKAGKPNWQISLPASKGGGTPLKVQVGQLKIQDGVLHIDDPALKTDFGMKFHTTPAAGDKRAQFLADAQGRYAGQPITAHFAGGAVLSLRDPSHPYSVDFSAVNGATHIRLIGTIEQPMKLDGVNLRLTLRGRVEMWRGGGRSGLSVSVPFG